jgi:hypothetical protein
VARARLDNAAGQAAVVSAGRQERLDWGLSRCLGGCVLGFLPDHSDRDLAVAGEAVFEGVHWWVGILHLRLAINIMV